MRTLLLAVALAACIAGRAAADPAEDALFAKAEACIRSAAPDVAAKADGLVDGINAVAWRCAVEIDHAQNYDANARTLADWQGRSSPAQLTGVSLDPQTGELKTPPGFKMEWDSSAASVRELSRDTPRTRLLAIAAEAVIAASKPGKWH